jgi:hypothetical protein
MGCLVALLTNRLGIHARLPSQHEWSPLSTPRLSMHLLFHLLENQHVVTVADVLVHDNDLHPASEPQLQSTTLFQRSWEKLGDWRDDGSLCLGLHWLAINRASRCYNTSLSMAFPCSPVHSLDRGLHLSREDPRSWRRVTKSKSKFRSCSVQYCQQPKRQEGCFGIFAIL